MLEENNSDACPSQDRGCPDKLFLLPEDSCKKAYRKFNRNNLIMKRKEKAEPIDTLDVIASAFQSLTSKGDLDDPTLLCQVEYDLSDMKGKVEVYRKSGSDSCESTSSSLPGDLDHCHNKKRKEFHTGPTTSSSPSSPLNSTVPLLELFNQDTGNEVNRNPMLKRRIRRVNNNPFPRILKSDIRRSLAAMYVNVMNSGDMEMVGSFFRTFCVGHCDAIFTVNDNILCRGEMPFRLSHEGLSSLEKHMQALSAIPDMIVSLEKSSIQHSLHESGSKVIMKVLKRWTIVNETIVDFLHQDGQMRRTPLPFFDTLLEDNLVKEEDMICKHVVNIGAAELNLHLW
eukprot:scaffold1593_cov170-Ochromonas_danica.AAC.1